MTAAMQWPETVALGVVFLSFFGFLALLVWLDYRDDLP